MSNYKERFEQLATSDYDFKLGEYISDGFKIFEQNIMGFIGFTIIVFAIYFALNFIPIVGNIALVIIAGPLSAGYFIVARKILKQEDYHFEDFFQGFKKFQVLFFTSFIGDILTAIGIILFIIPGIYLATAYIFSIPIALFSDMEFWDCLESSRKLITKNWFSFFAFLVVLTLINIAGLLVLGVGILVAFPVAMCAIYTAYEDIVGTTDEGEKDLLEHLIE